MAATNDAAVVYTTSAFFNVATAFPSDAGAGFRDTDRYRFRLSEEVDVEWCATAEFPVVLRILNGVFCGLPALATTWAGPFSPACASLRLPAGTYKRSARQAQHEPAAAPVR